jgi:hypothetical protein
LWNDPKFALPSYTGCSIVKSQRNWSVGPAKKEQEKMLKLHWAVLDASEMPESPWQK